METGRQADRQTGRQADRQTGKESAHTLPVHTIHHDRKQVTSAASFQSNKISPRAHTHTRCARSGREREKERVGAREGKRSKRELQQPGFPRGPPPQY